jgi:hypothetical protein
MPGEQFSLAASSKNEAYVNLASAKTDIGGNL